MIKEHPRPEVRPAIYRWGAFFGYDAIDGAKLVNTAVGWQKLERRFEHLWVEKRKIWIKERNQK